MRHDATRRVVQRRYLACAFTRGAYIAAVSMALDGELAYAQGSDTLNVAP